MDERAAPAPVLPPASDSISAGWAARLLRTRTVIALMVALQLLWLLGKGLLPALLGWLNLPFLPIAQGQDPDAQALLYLAGYTVVLGGLAALLPAPARGLARLKRWIRQRDRHAALALAGAALVTGGLCALVISLQVDEEHLLSASHFFASQGFSSFFDHYEQLAWLGQRHPPLVPLVAGSVLRVAGPHLLAVRFFFLLFLVGTTLLTYALGRDLYGRRAGLLAGLFFLSMRYVFVAGTPVMNDLPVTFFFVLALYLALRALSTQRYRDALWSGLAFGAGLLTKYTMALLYPLLGLLALGAALRQYPARQWMRPARLLTVCISVSLVMLGGWAAYAYHLGALGAQGAEIADLARAGQRADGTLRALSDWSLRLKADTLFFALPSALGLYNLPLLFLGLASLVVRRARPDRLVLLWIAAVAVPLFLTLPIQRYFMPAFPAFALAMACGWQRLPGASLRPVLLAVTYSVGSIYLYA